MTVKYFPHDPVLRAKSSGSWRDIGLWYTQLTAASRQPMPEIQKKVADLTSGTTTLLDKMQALASFLQHDVRYVAIEVGIGGFHEPGAITTLREPVAEHTETGRVYNPTFPCI